MSRTIVVPVLAVVLGLAHLWFRDLPTRQLVSTQPTASRNEQTYEVKTVSEMQVTRDWFDFLRSQRRQSDTDAVLRPDPDQRERPAIGGTYRTLCVRLCDGFAFPISYSTRRERFARDAKRCKEICPSGSRLFVHRQPGQDAGDMADLQGRPYRTLRTAFLYKTQYVPDCTCRGNPWDEAALARHRAYAEASKQSTTTKTAEKTLVPAYGKRRAARQARVARSEQQRRREADDD
jgi:hypothetical protein